MARAYSTRAAVRMEIPETALHNRIPAHTGISAVDSPRSVKLYGFRATKHTKAVLDSSKHLEKRSFDASEPLNGTKALVVNNQNKYIKERTIQNFHALQISRFGKMAMLTLPDDDGCIHSSATR